MTKKEDIKDLCTSGAFRPFLALAEEALASLQRVEYGDPSKMAYEVGKRDGAEEFISILKEKINANSR